MEWTDGRKEKCIRCCFYLLNADLAQFIQDLHQLRGSPCNVCLATPSAVQKIIVRLFYLGGRIEAFKGAPSVQDLSMETLSSHSVAELYCPSGGVPHQT